MNTTKTSNFTVSIALCIIGSLLISCSSESTDWQLANLEGNVKSFTEKWVHIPKKSSSPTPPYITYTRVSYDTLGYCTLRERLDDDLCSIEKTILERNGVDLTQEIVYNRYNEVLQTRKVKSISKSGCTMDVYNQYNRKSFETEQVYGNNKIKRYFSHFIKLDGSGRETSTVAYKYNSKGKLSKIYVDKENQGSYYMRYEYVEFDAHNNWTKRFVHFKRGGGKENKTQIQTRFYEYY
ncbi:MAG: hypothetical protein AAF617_10120 [Bacteroidota bacterium]